MSPDPFGGDILNPQSLNRYTYVINNPATLTDHYGAVLPFGYQQLMQDSWGIQAGSIQFGSNWNAFWVYESQSQELQSLFKTGQISATLLDALGQPIGNDTSSQLYFVGNAFSPLGVVDLVYEQQVSYQILSSPSMPPGASAAAHSPISGRPSPQTQKPAVPPKVGPSPKPDTPATWDSCKFYRDGTGAGETLYQICKTTPNGAWWNCVRGGLLSQFTPNDNLLDLTTRYLVVDHSYYFGWCATEVLR